MTGMTTRELLYTLEQLPDDQKDLPVIFEQRDLEGHSVPPFVTYSVDAVTVDEDEESFIRLVSIE